MKACVVIGALCVLSLVSAVPVHNGMFRLKRMCSVVWIHVIFGKENQWQEEKCIWINFGKTIYFSGLGMVFYHMPYYNPHQAMLMHYSPQSGGRSSSTSAFATGDTVAAGSVVRGI